MRALVAIVVALASPATAQALQSWSGPVPVDSGPGDQARLNAVACPVLDRCVAVDNRGREVTFDPAAPASARVATITTHSEGQDNLRAVSCPTATQCVAVDNFGQESSFDPGSPVAGARQIDSLVIRGGPVLNGVSCPAAHLCAAVDSDGGEVTFDPGSPGRPPRTLIDKGHAARLYGRYNVINAISCPTVSQCTAVDAGGEEITFDPSSPTVLRIRGLESERDLFSISCPAARQCTTVDDVGHEVTFDPTMHKRVEPFTLDSSQVLNAVSCPSMRLCVAVALSGAAFQGDPDGAWTRAALSPEDRLWGVACATSNSCAAVGESGEAFIGPASLPVGSHGQAIGFTTRRPRISFQIAAPVGAAPIDRVAVNLSSGSRTLSTSIQGVAFSRSRRLLARGVDLSSGAHRLTAQVSRIPGRLLITPANSSRRLAISIAAPALSVSSKIARLVRSGRLKTLRIHVLLMRAGQSSTSISLPARVS